LATDNFELAPEVPESAFENVEDFSPKEAGNLLIGNLDLLQLVDPITGETAVGESIFIAVKAVDEVGLRSPTTTPTKADVTKISY